MEHMNTPSVIFLCSDEFALEFCVSGSPNIVASKLHNQIQQLGYEL